MHTTTGMMEVLAGTGFWLMVLMVLLAKRFTGEKENFCHE